MQQVHGVDDQGDVPGVLALGIGEILLRLNGEPGENLGPSAQLRTGEVAVDSAGRSFSKRGYLGEKRIGYTGGSVFRIDQNREPRRINLRRHQELKTKCRAATIAQAPCGR